MPAAERTIRAILENIPALMFAAALIAATFLSHILGVAERYLTWFLFLPVGVQGIWAGTTHVAFPDVGARYIGWQKSPFQTEVGFADLAMGSMAVLSFWSGLEFKAAVVLYATVFYCGVSFVHLRDRLTRGNVTKGNFGALLIMTIVKIAGLPLLLWITCQG